jgi:myo-inositol-1(or 4)-monophosphatase
VSPELTEYLAFAHRLADASAEAIRPYFHTHLAATDKKDRGSTYSPVTAADQAAEAVMRRLINETYPDHGIFGEEQGVENLDAEYVWVLDPIDGTRSFLVGFPIFGTLIALNHRGTVEIGIMNQAISGERFVAGPEGAFLGEKRIKTRSCADLADAVLCYSGPWLYHKENERRVFDQVVERVTLTMHVGDCYNYCMLALGLIDLVIETELNPWDIQALIPIVEQAGGIVTTWNGGRAEDGGQVIACGDRRLYDQVMPILAPAAGA